MMKGSGNVVPQGPTPQPRNAAESDNESYSGSSYTATESDAAPQQQQHQQQQQGRTGAAATPARTPLPTGNHSPAGANLPPSPAPQRQHQQQPPQQQQQQQGEEGGESAQKKKGRAARGKQKAKTMVNTALDAPAARVRAMTGAVTGAIVGKDSQRTVIYVFFCVAWVHLLFLILSTTLSQIDVSGGGCYTYWGYKAQCDTVSYTNRTALITSCNAVRSSLQAGAAFSILAILASTAIVAMAWILCSRIRAAARLARHQNRYREVDEMTQAAQSRPPGVNAANGNAKPRNPFDFHAGQLKLVMIIVVAISLLCELIAWAVIAGINTRRYCDAVFLWSTTATYGVGFGLGLTAWLLELIVFAVFIPLA